MPNFVFCTDTMDMSNPLTSSFERRVTTFMNTQCFGHFYYKPLSSLPEHLLYIEYCFNFFGLPLNTFPYYLTLFYVQ